MDSFSIPGESHTSPPVTVPYEAGMERRSRENVPRLRIGTNAQAGLVVGESVESSPHLQAVCDIECDGILAARH
jgi:hypothetical protein